MFWHQRNSNSCITSASEAKSIVCIGEALIDFVAMTPGTLDRVNVFKRAAGGAPANVAVGLSRLGVPGFVAGLWARLVSKIDRLSQSDAVDACRFANIVGGLTTTKRGAIDALPRLSQ